MQTNNRYKRNQYAYKRRSFPNRKIHVHNGIYKRQVNLSGEKHGRWRRKFRGKTGKLFFLIIVVLLPPLQVKAFLREVEVCSVAGPSVFHFIVPPVFYSRYVFIVLHSLMYIFFTNISI